MDRSMLVFIASPGDVREERAAVRRVVDEIDIRVARPLGWTVRAVGWEHQRPGLGRPQDLINPAVAECDVLVGILGTGWGTDTGLYSSGFEEEFELIAARHAQGELVEGMLYLRRLSDGTAADPANVAFRERVRTRAMYKEYVGLADFEHKLLGDLVEMLMVLERRAREEEVASADAALTMRPSEDTGSGVVDATVELPSGSHHGEVQAADALRLVAEGDNDELTVIRAHLATAARLSAQLTSGLLDVHDLNRAYIHRASLKLSEEERALVLRSAVAIGSAGPCWALLPGDDDEALRSVAAVALRDSQPEVRRGAFQELGPTGIRELAARIETSDFSSVDFFEMLLADDDAGVRSEALDALSVSDLPRRIELLRAAVEAGPVQARAFEVLVRILVEVDPDAALELIAATPVWTPADAVTALELVADTLRMEGIEMLLGSNPTARVIGVKLLAAAGLPSDERARELLADEDVSVRREAAAALAAMGVVLETDLFEAAIKDLDDSAIQRLLRKGPDDHELRRARFAAMTPDERAGETNWLDVGGGDALAAAIAQGDDGVAERARTQLREGLDSLREADVQRWIARHGDKPQAQAVADRMAEEYHDLMDRLWLAGALAGLATAPVPDDIDLARSYADHDDLSVRRAARRLLSVTATTHDTGLIVRLADAEHDAALGVDLLTAALRTSGFDAALDAAESLDRPDSLVARALDLADRIDLDVDVERVEGLLASDSRDVRSAALRILVRTFDEPSLLALLDRWAAATPRYYDVVGRLDRLVHGPEFARNRVTRELAGA